MQKRFRFIIYFWFIFIISSCGGIKLDGSGTSPNDPTPSGNVVAQAQFSGLNGASPASGSAVIYLSGTSYTLYLVGLSFPSENGLVARVNATNGGQVASVALLASTGTQSLDIDSVAFQTNFSSVYIFSTQHNENYASAFFTLH